MCLTPLIPVKVQVLVDVLAEALGGDALMQLLQAAMEAALAQHGVRSMQAAKVLDVSWAPLSLPLCAVPVQAEFNLPLVWLCWCLPLSVIKVLGAVGTLVSNKNSCALHVIFNLLCCTHGAVCRSASTVCVVERACTALITTAPASNRPLGCAVSTPTPSWLRINDHAACLAIRRVLQLSVSCPSSSLTHGCLAVLKLHTPVRVPPFAADMLHLYGLAAEVAPSAAPGGAPAPAATLLEYDLLSSITALAPALVPLLGGADGGAVYWVRRRRGCAPLGSSSLA